MKEKLTRVFKETPERFFYTIESTLSEIKLTKKRKSFTAPVRVVVSIVLVLALLPSAVFGAVKMCGVIAQRTGCFGIAFDIKINEDVPHYLKMSIDVPEGFKEQPNSGKLKYDRDCEEWVFGFTIMPTRFYESIDHTLQGINVNAQKRT